ncbi:hypothetical protein H5410_005095, partial [Solanum commersonii]
DGEIMTDMNGFMYTECAKMIISMYVELVGLLHEKMGTNSDNIHMDISGKYPCSIQDRNVVFQVSGHHGYHMNLLAQNYGFNTSNQPHFVEPIVQPSIQQLSMHGHTHRSFGGGSSSQCILIIATWNIRPEIQNHDIPYLTLENEEDIFMSTCESEMENGSVWSEEAKKDLKKDLNRLIWRAASARQVRKFESLMWKIKEENVEAHEYLMEIPLDKCTVSHDDGIRKGVLTTNLSESFNGVLKKERGLSVTAMVTDRMRGLARNFVREYFTIENYVATYSGSFSLVGHEAYWLSPSFRMRSNEFYCCPNRLRTTRIPLNLAHNLVVVEDIE